MNIGAFLTHFACVMIGGTLGVVLMAILQAGDDR